MSTNPDDLNPPADQAEQGVLSGDGRAPGEARDSTLAADGENRPAAQPRSPGRRALAALREIAVIVISALALSLLIKTFLVQAFYIPSSSMEDTLQVDDRVLVSKLAPQFFDVNRGDIVVFKDPGGWLPPVNKAASSGLDEMLTNVLTFTGLLPADAGEHLIKRVVAVGGDKISCCGDSGLISVNGVEIDESYLKPGAVPSEVSFTVTVPDGYVWVMGDNRQDSADSRFHPADEGGGAVSLDQVVGIASVRMWPLDRLAVLRNPGATFSEVPGGGSYSPDDVVPGDGTEDAEQGDGS